MNTGKGLLALSVFMFVTVQAYPVTFDANQTGLTAFKSAIGYMKVLHHQMESYDVSHFLGSVPTAIWCFLDKDVARGTVRPAQRLESESWSVTYIFNWTDMMTSIDLNKAILRLYLQPLTKPRSSRNNVSVPVMNIRIVAKLKNGDIFSAPDVVRTAQNSTGWIEFDITEGIVAALSSISTAADIELHITISPGGDGQLAAFLMDLAAMQPLLRESYIQYQPMLLVYVSDSQIKRKILEQLFPLDDELNLKRQKRETETYPEACQIQNFTVTFSDIGLNFVLIPYSYNARKCTGLCSAPYFKGVADVSNYALLINSAKAAHSLLSLSEKSALKDRYVPPQNGPCCVPTRYSPLIITTQQLDGSIKTGLFSEMVVEACGCR